jgi:hypothetical protein
LIARSRNHKRLLAIQKLAGRSELGLTQRYMYLRPAALDAAIQLLDGGGNMMATAANNS